MAFVYPFRLPYYLTHPEEYCRRPMDPLFVVLVAFAITSWKYGSEQKLVQRVGIDAQA